MSTFSNSPYTFGENPTYASWTPNTEVTLCRVPWANDYRDVVKFDTEADLDKYLDNQGTMTVKYNQTSLITPTTPIKVDISLSDAYQFNYVRVRNFAQPGVFPAGENAGSRKDIARTYYYFINDAQYHAVNSTQLMVQLDVWQTFSRFVTFGNCYVERGHIGIANSKQFQNQGRDYLTIPEGLDIGSEYWIKSVDHLPIAGANFYNSQAPFSILIAASLDLNLSGGTVDAPIIKTGRGSNVEAIPNGLNLYLFPTMEDFTAYMLSVADEPWVTSSIISCTIIPADLIPYGGNTGNVQVANVASEMYWIMIGTIPIKELTLGQNFRHWLAPGGRYQHLKKFMVSPYSLVEVTTNSGTPLILKPECLADDDLTVVQMSHVVPPDPRIGFYPRNYNKGSQYELRSQVTGDLLNDFGEFMDMMTGIMNFPQFSIINDGYLMYMASNRNGIAYQYNSADWTQQRALMGNQLSYNQSSVAMGTANQMTNLSNQAVNQNRDLNNQTLAYRSIQSAGNGIANGMAMGGPAGAFTGVMGAANAAAGMAIGANQNNQSAAITTNLNSGRNKAILGQMGYNRDTNRSYADWAARGDYGNEIMAINAKVHDARMIQPTVSGQVGGDAFNLTTVGWQIMAKYKTIDNAVMRMIGEFWLRYGYAINQFIKLPPSFMVMTKFTYWKLKETYVVSATCPELYKATLRGIFEKGVTVWANPNDVGNIDIADNQPLSGVSY